MAWVHGPRPKFLGRGIDALRQRLQAWGSGAQAKPETPGRPGPWALGAAPHTLAYALCPPRTSAKILN
eukprot:9114975-Pyramimonas_sp.AAC.1